jgi:Zn-dependent protease with chaperone function
MVSPQKLTGLRPQAYEHPSDQAALDVLAKTPGLDTLVRKLNAWGFERLLRVQLTGSYLHVLPENLPDLAGTLHTACETLDLPSPPDLYIAPSGELNASTMGVERPLIVVNSATVDFLTPEELLFVIAHEVGHIKSSHVLYYQMADYFPVIAGILGDVTFNLGKLLSTPMEVALMSFKRTAEFTADRAGLLACQDVDVALRTMVKLAGLPGKYRSNINTEDFVRQAREFEAMDSDKLSVVAKWLSVMGASHPWTVMRARQLLQWIDSGGYEQVLKDPKKVTSQTAPGVIAFCTNCGAPLHAGELFCRSCGRSVAAPTAGH